MAKKFPLDKYLASGTEYKTDDRQVLVIEKVGTDSTSKGTLTVDQVPCLEVIQNIAPLRKSNSYLIGPIDLKELFVVVPPETKFKFTGSSGSYLRIIGWVIQLDPKEAVPGDLMSRYKGQGKHYLTYLTGSYSHGTDTAWADGVENEVLSVTPSTVEKYVLKRELLLTKAGGTFTPRMFALKMYLENTPLEYIFSDTIKEGIDVYSIPDYDDVSENEEPFSLEEFPIEIEGDRTFSVKVKNISGSSLSPSSGASWTFTLYIPAEYMKE